LDNEDAFSSLIELFEKLKLYCQKNSLSKLYKTLIQADKEGGLNILLEAWMYREDQRQSYGKLATIIRHRRMIDANVSKDSVLFSLAMSQQ